MTNIDLKGKKVFITGITGFKGSWLALMCKELGADSIAGIGLAETRHEHIFNQAGIKDIAQVYIGDMLDLSSNFDAIYEMMDSDIVFHLAAQPIVSIGFENPVYTFRNNTDLTLILHEILTSAYKKMSVINVTTDKVYQPLKRPHTEDDVLFGEDPYSLSKSFADMVSTLYVNTYFNKLDVPVIVSSMRAGNVIGGGDIQENRIMTDIVNSIWKDKDLEIRNPASIRPYQYVLDCLYAYILLAVKQYDEPELAGKYNIGPTPNTVVNTMTLIESCEKVGLSFNHNLDGKSIGKENEVLLLDSTKLREKLNWKPRYDNIDEITKTTLEWFSNMNNDKDMAEYSRKEVKEFLKEVKDEED